MEHWNNNNYFVIVRGSFLTKDIIILLFNFVFIRSLDLKLIFIFFNYWMISRPGYFGFRRKYWIQLFGSKVRNVGRRLVKLRFDFPPGKVRRRVVEWTAGWTPRVALMSLSRRHLYRCLLSSVFISVCSKLSAKMVIGWLFGFYGISTFFGYLTPNLFLWN